MIRKYWPVAVVAIYGFVLAATAAVGTYARPVPAAPHANLFDKPLGEDAFYMLSVARSLGEGHGITYGGIHTTGIQPLATFLYAGIYWLAEAAGLSATMPLRVVIFLNVLFLLLIGWLSCLIVARQLRPRNNVLLASWVVPLIFIVNSQGFRVFTYGLETGLYLVLIVSLQLAFATRRHPLVIGLLFGCCFLARLDFAVLGGVVFIWKLITREIRFRDGLLIGGTALVIASPWIWYVHAITQGIMPSSGAAEGGLVTSLGAFWQRAFVMISAASASILVIFYLPLQSPLLNAILVTVATVIVYFVVGRKPRDTEAITHSNVPWLMGSICLTLYYVVASGAGHFYGRYLAPFWLIWTQMAAAAIVGEITGASLQRRKIVQLQVFVLVVFVAQIGYTLHRGSAGNSHLFTAFFVKEHEDDLGTVGAFQSGLIGYVLNERVVNLDGKLDGRALMWRQVGHEECYLAERHINTVIDWPDYINNGWIDPTFVRNNMRVVGYVPGGASAVMAVNTSAVRCQ